MTGRVPLRDLKVALANPSKYVKSFGAGTGGGGPSKYGMLLFAIGEFHKTRDPKKAQDYLESHITKNFKNVSDLSKYAQWLQLYVRDFATLGNTFVNIRDGIAIPLPARFNSFSVSGQAARVDLDRQGGYSIWVFVRDEPGWKDDPRMPLLQQAYSQKLGVGLNDISVGTFDFVNGKHTSTQYSQARINRVQRALWKLLILIQRKK
jgi:hypothetical protein